MGYTGIHGGCTWVSSVDGKFLTALHYFFGGCKDDVRGREDRDDRIAHNLSTPWAMLGLCVLGGVPSEMKTFLRGHMPGLCGCIELVYLGQPRIHHSGYFCGARLRRLGLFGESLCSTTSEKYVGFTPHSGTNIEVSPRHVKGLKWRRTHMSFLWDRDWRMS